MVNSGARTAVRLTGSFASPRLVEAIRQASRSWRFDTGFPAPVPALDEPGFNAALLRAVEGIEMRLGHHFPDFASDLNREAMRKTLVAEGPEGAPATIHAALFAVPVHGSARALDALSDDPAGLQALADSFHEHGVVSGDAEVFVVRRLFGTAAFGLALPGTVRAILNLLMAHRLAGEGPDPEAEVARLLDVADGLGDVTGPKGDLGSRAILCLRVVAAMDGAGPGDYVSGFMPEAIDRAEGEPDADADDEAEDLPGAESAVDGDGTDLTEPGEPPEIIAWLGAVNRGGDTVTYAPPTHWMGAVAMMACLHIQHGLGVLLKRAGKLDSPVEVVHVHRDRDLISVGLIVGGTLVGPVSVSRGLVAGEPDELDRSLGAYDAPIEFHEDESPFPAMAA
jgi:hypothetical protein